MDLALSPVPKETKPLSVIRLRAEVVEKAEMAEMETAAAEGKPLPVRRRVRPVRRRAAETAAAAHAW